MGKKVKKIKTKPEDLTNSGPYHFCIKSIASIFSPLRHVIPSLTGNLLFKGGADDVVVDDVLEQVLALS